MYVYVRVCMHVCVLAVVCLLFGVVAVSVPFCVCGALVCTLSQFAVWRRVAAGPNPIRVASVHIARTLLVPTSSSIDHERSRATLSVGHLSPQFQRCSQGLPRTNSCHPFFWVTALRGPSSSIDWIIIDFSFYDESSTPREMWRILFTTL